MLAGFAGDLAALQVNMGVGSSVGLHALNPGEPIEDAEDPHTFVFAQLAAGPARLPGVTAAMVGRGVGED